ncbi:hypothetical protein PROFUN_09997 [Planoprotostelium fungivorum]|uniref:Uncharacterized protein n=1 Tax=Planoprotostelium fungivorum TaxID=1890364 RepID=A0A2P6NFS6_9EUKA|nr:hypothetical protein PROFUN_09997 [Planoprotostelium fungivorum]
MHAKTPPKRGKDEPLSKRVKPEFISGPPKTAKATTVINKRPTSLSNAPPPFVQDWMYSQANRVDLGKIITDSWLMEKSDVGALEVEANPDFFMPKKQVELLEKTSNELNNINSRVMQTLMQYETANSHDDVFQLIEEDDDIQFTTGFDRKSIMEESKGKVKVLIVDYNKLGIKRENLLSSLREWFDEVKNDIVVETTQPEEDRMLMEDGVDAINQLFATAHANKEKLTDLHSELVDYFKERSIPTSSNSPTQIGDIAFLQPMVDSLSRDLEEAMMKLSDTESKAASLEKMLERKEEELKFYRNNDQKANWKEELFSLQQNSQERELQLMKELQRVNKQLEKTRSQMDSMIAEMIPKDVDSTEVDLSSVDLEDLKHLYKKADSARRLLDMQVKLIHNELEGLRQSRDKEIELSRSQKEEEFNNRMIKTRSEHNDNIEKIKREYMGKVSALQNDFESKMTLSATSIENAVQDKDSKKIVEMLKNSFQDRLETYKEIQQAEQARLSEEWAEREAQLRSEYQSKLQSLKDIHEAEKSKLAAENQNILNIHEAAVKYHNDSRAISEQMSVSSGVVQLKKQLGGELKELQDGMHKKEEAIREMTERIDMLNEMVHLEQSKREHQAEMQAERTDEKLLRKANANGNDQLLDMDRVKANFHQEKKKAVELAQYKIRMEKEAMVSTMQARFVIEKELALQAERATLEEAKKQIRIDEAKAVLLEHESKSLSLREEIDHLKRVLEDERSKTEQTQEVNSELMLTRLTHERTIADLREKYTRVVNLLGPETVLTELETVTPLESDEIKSVRTPKGAMSSDPDTVSENEEPKVETETSITTEEGTPRSRTPVRTPRTPSASSSKSPRPLSAHLSPRPQGLTPRTNRARAASSTTNDRQIEEEEIESTITTTKITPRPRSVDTNIPSITLGEEVETTDNMVLESLDKNVSSIRDKLKSGGSEKGMNAFMEAAAENKKMVKELVEANKKEVTELNKDKEYLEKKVHLLNNEIDRMRKMQKTEEVANRVEFGSKAEMLETVLTERNELRARVNLLMEDNSNLRLLMNSLESKRMELEDLVKALDSKTSDGSSALTSGTIEEHLHRIGVAVEKERAHLHNKMGEIESRMTVEITQAKQAVETMKLNGEREREREQEQHDQFIKGIVGNYEKRIKGLTEALTTCLNDGDVLDELKRDNEQSMNHAKLMNEREIARVRENMKRLEEDHKQSLSTIQNSDRSELKRMYDTIDRLKNEFSVLLEEERLSLVEGEHTHAELLEKIKQEFDLVTTVSQSKSVTEEGPVEDDSEFKELIDSGINAVSALYNAMSTVLKNRRQISSNVIKDKINMVGVLQEEMITKTRALLESKDKILDQEKALSKMKSEQSINQFNKEISLAEVRAKLMDQEQLTATFRDKYLQNETVISSLLSEKQGGEQREEVLRQQIVELQMEIAALQKELASLRKQMVEAAAYTTGFNTAHGITPPAFPTASKSTARRTISATNRSFSSIQPRSNSPPSLSIGPHRESDIFVDFPPGSAEVDYTATAKDITTQPQTAQQLRQKAMMKQLQIQHTVNNLSLASGVNALAATFSHQDRNRTKFVERIWKSVMNTAPKDEEDAQKRARADDLLKQDKKLRQARTSMAFAALREKMRLRITMEQLSAEGNDRIATALRRIEERHKKTITRWEQRKRTLIEQREEHWMKVLQAIMSIAEFQRYTASIPPMYSVQSETGSFVVKSVPSRTDAYTRPIIARQDPVIQPKKQRDSLYVHSINYKDYQPFAPLPGPLTADKILHKGLYVSKEWSRLKSALERQVEDSFDMILSGISMEGKSMRMTPQEHTHSNQQHSVRPSSQGKNRLPHLHTSPHLSSVVNQTFSLSMPSSQSNRYAAEESDGDDYGGDDFEEEEEPTVKKNRTKDKHNASVRPLASWDNESVISEDTGFPVMKNGKSNGRNSTGKLPTKKTTKTRSSADSTSGTNHPLVQAFIEKKIADNTGNRWSRVTQVYLDSNNTTNSRRTYHEPETMWEKVEELKKKVLELDQERTMLKTRCAWNEKEIASRDKQIEEILSIKIGSNMNTALFTKLMKENQTIKGMRTKITKLEDDSLKKEQELETLRQRMKQTRVDKIEEQIHELHLKNQSLEQQATSNASQTLKTQITELEERVNKYKTAYKRKSEKLAETESRISAHISQIEEHQNNYQSLNTQHQQATKSHQESMNDVTKQLKSIEAENREMRGEIEELRRQLEELQPPPEDDLDMDFSDDEGGKKSRKKLTPSEEEAAKRIQALYRVEKEKRLQSILGNKKAIRAAIKIQKVWRMHHGKKLYRREKYRKARQDRSNGQGRQREEQERLKREEEERKLREEEERARAEEEKQRREEEERVRKEEEQARKREEEERSRKEEEERLEREKEEEERRETERRSEEDKERRQKEEKAAVQIQSTYRGHIGRKEALNRRRQVKDEETKRKEEEERQKQMEEAQAKEREQNEIERQKKEEEEKKREEEKREEERRRQEEEKQREEQKKEEERRHSAATKIQSAERGRAARKEAANRRIEKSAEDETKRKEAEKKEKEEEETRRSKAAVLFQKLWRGIIQRRAFRKRFPLFPADTLEFTYDKEPQENAPHTQIENEDYDIG